MQKLNVNSRDASEKTNSLENSPAQSRSNSAQKKPKEGGTGQNMTQKEMAQLDTIIKRLEAIREKESIYNDTIIPEKLLTKEDVQLLIVKSTYVFKQENVLVEI